MEFPHEPETGVVRRIFDLCLNGYGMRNILRELDELGFRARNGKRFRKGLVESILKNEGYTGTLKFADIRVENAHSPIMELIRSSLEKKKPLELRNFLKGFIQRIVITSTGVKVQYNPLYMVMSNKLGSSLFPMLAPRAGSRYERDNLVVNPAFGGTTAD